MARFVLTVSVLLCCFLASISGACGGETFRFFSIGDWGTGGKKQKQVAKVLGEMADRLKPEFVVSLGDNFYFTGVKDVKDRKWQRRFERVYTHSSLQVPWCAVAGNHDWAGGTPEAQVDYHHQNKGGKWYMPHLWYNRKWSIDGGRRTLEIIFVDTVLLAPQEFLEGMDQKLKRLFMGGKKDASMVDLKERGARQMKWLKETLAASTADWLLVAGHYPVYSAGTHGNTAELLTTLKPLLDEHNVVAYMCGHDHSLQHLSSMEVPAGGGGNGVAYLVSGSGGASTTKVRDMAERRFAVKDSGFMVHEIEGDIMKVTIVGKDGKELYTTELAPRGRKSGSGKMRSEVVEPEGLILWEEAIKSRNGSSGGSSSIVVGGGALGAASRPLAGGKVLLQQEMELVVGTQ